MALEIEIRSNSKQAEASLKKILNAIDQLPENAKRADNQLKNAFSTSFSGLEKNLKVQNREISKFSNKVGTDLTKLNSSVDKTSKVVQQASKNITSFIRTTSIALGGLLAAGGITSISSQFTELSNRIALTTGRTSALASQQAKLFAVSRRSNAQLSTTINLYSSLALNTKASNEEALALTETLIKAGKIGGGSAATIDNAIIQLQQGLASGVLRGEELNSVLEGLPRVAQALAQELGKDIGQLKGLAAQGRITGEVVRDALVNSAGQINKEFDTLTVSLSTSLGNAGRNIGIELNRVFTTISGNGRVGSFIESIGSSIANFLRNLSVQIRVLQTEFLLFRLGFDNAFTNFGTTALATFQKLVDGVVDVSSKLAKGTAIVKSWASDIAGIFFDLFIEVVGNSTFPDMVDGVVDYSKNLNKGISPTKSFTQKYAKLFSELGSSVKSSLDNSTSDTDSGLSGLFSRAGKVIAKVVRTITAGTIEGIARAISLAFVVGFAGLLVAGGLAGSLGAKIATAFVGVIAAYFAGFASNFDIQRAGENGIIAEILRNQENLLFTIADGISSIASGAAALSPLQPIKEALDFASKNIVELATALPFFLFGLKTLFSGLKGAGNTLLNPLGTTALGAGNAVGDVFQSRLAQSQILPLQAETERLQAELGGVSEAFANEKIRLQNTVRDRASLNQQLADLEVRKNDILTKGFTDERGIRRKGLLTQIRENQKTLQLTSQLLDGPVSRLRDAISRSVLAFGQVGGVVGGTLGSFLTAGVFSDLAKSFGFNAGESFITILLGSQIGAIVGASIGNAIFRVFATLITFALNGIFISIFAKLTPIIFKAFFLPLKRAVTAVLASSFLAPVRAFFLGLFGIAVRASLIATFVLVSAIQRAAIVTASATGAALYRTAIIAGSVLAQAAAFAGTFALLNAIPIALGAAVTALLDYAFSDDSIFQQAGKWLGGAIFEGVTWAKQLGKDISDAIYEGISWVTTLGSDIATAIRNGLLNFVTSNPTGPDQLNRFASGGMVRGKGTGTSDSIPAMLSNGEYVVNSRSTSKNKDILEYLNRTGSLPGYALGGLVMPPEGYTGPAKYTKDIRDLFGGVSTYDNLNKKVVDATTKTELIEAINNFVEEEILLDSKRTGLSTGLYNVVYGDDPYDAYYNYVGNYKPRESDGGLSPKIAPELKLPKISESDSIASILERAAVIAHEIGHMRDVNRRLVANSEGPLGDFRINKMALMIESFSKKPGDFYEESTASASALKAFDNVVGPAGVPITDSFDYRKALGFSLLSYITSYPFDYARMATQVFSKPADVGDHLNSIDGGFALDFVNDYMVNQNGDSSNPSFRGMSLNPIYDIVTEQSQFTKDLIEAQAKVGIFEYYAAEEGRADYINEMTQSFLNRFVDAQSALMSYAMSDTGFATGGSVFGSGGPTSDSIPAMLSNGEFVVKTSVADKHRGFLESLNNTGRIPGFSDGGSVGDTSGTSFSGFTSGLKDLLNQLDGLLAENLGEGYDTVKDVLQNLLGFLEKGVSNLTGFGDQAPNPNAEILTPANLADAIASIDFGNVKFDTKDLEAALNPSTKEGLDLTKRLLSLNESRAKVESKIAEAGEEASLELTTQLAILNKDIIKELGELGILLNENKEIAERQIEAINQLAQASLQSFKSETQGGIAGLLKGELNLEGFAKGILDSFTGTVLDTLAGGITQGIFNTESGQLSGIGTTLEKLFTKLGLGGFDIGSSIGGTLDSAVTELGTIANPMFVRIVGAFGGGSGGGLPPIATDDDFLNIDQPDFETGGLANLGLPPIATDDDFLNIDQPNFETGGLVDGEEAAGPFGAIFEKFTGSISGIFSSLPSSLSGVFGGLLGGLKGAFSGLTSLFSGGGGGGGIGGLFSAIGGFFNDGGIVPGGGPVPAIVHGGEMILNKRQQSNLFDNMDKSKNMSQQQNVSINVTGDISRQTKKEIFTMLPQIATGVNQYNVEKGN